jgi:hypothetical protein
MGPFRLGKISQVTGRIFELMVLVLNPVSPRVQFSKRRVISINIKPGIFEFLTNDKDVQAWFDDIWK